MANFVQIFDKLKENYEKTARSREGVGYSRLSSIFGELDSVLREYVQDLTQEPVKALLRKLENQQELNDEEKNLIRLWIVGDAEYYTRLENNVPEWQQELKRIMDEISRLKTDNPDAATALRLQGLLRDGARVIADLFYFAQQEERGKKFAEAIREIDAEERGLLIGLLRQKLVSPDY